MVLLTSKFTKNKCNELCLDKFWRLLACWARATQGIHCLQAIIDELKIFTINSCRAVLYS